MPGKPHTAMSFLLWGALALVNANASHAQATSVADYRDSLGGGTRATYVDLLKKIFPDVALAPGGGQDATAHETIRIRHLFGDYSGKVYRGEMKISSVERLNGQSKNKKALLLLVHVGSAGEDLFNWGEMSLLALFRLEPNVELLDAADVQADRFTSFWEELPLLPISPQEDAAIIASSHHNSSQGYLSLALVAAEKGKLRTIFELPTLLNMNVCGNSFSQTPSINALRSGRSAHFNISILVKMVKEPDNESCEKKTRGFTKYYKALLVWNASARKYASTGKALNQLSRFNEKSF